MADVGPAIRLEGLTRAFGSTRAVNGLSIDVPRGMIFGFLGPNGAGKTTTINLLLGLLEPTDGRAEVLGRDPWKDGDAVRSRTGAVLEHTGVYEHLSAQDNLEFYARVWRLTAADRVARLRELLVRMDLWDRRHEKAGTWSRGMQQRLAVARALLHRPQLVFLDEPTAGLDVMAATAVRGDLAELVGRDGTTIFLTTHNMAEAERLCSLVAVIRGGRLVALGSPTDLRAGIGALRVEIVGRGFDETRLSELRTRPDVLAIEQTDGHLKLQLAEHAEVGPLVSALVTGGAQVEEVRRGQASLEEVFVTLMEEDR
ncbi:MAG TPA: ABC transporter ATP-binding protein [Candidatus Limnocylindrales bacterium]|nr:ABC transporter ATP-binding protein [Candidatus Limnocylindrales bacterium]